MGIFSTLGVGDDSYRKRSREASDSPQRAKVPHCLQIEPSLSLPHRKQLIISPPLGSRCVPSEARCLPVLEFEGKKPRIHSTCYVAPTATIVGDVIMEEDSNVWPNAVIRADLNRIHIGKSASIQDCCVIHVDADHPAVFGDRTLMGHGAIAHGCQVGNNVLIGIRAVILDGVKIGDWVIIAAGSLLTEGTEIPSKSLVMGSPGKVVKELEERHFRMISRGNERYVKLGRTYRDRVG